MFKKILFGLLIAMAPTVTRGFAEEAKKIQDNSFLIEEAYNQEPGVIQHIQTFQYMKNRTWGYSFVQEWPVGGQTHQFSYTIPVYHLNKDGNKTGIGDVMINYRYQLIYKEKEGVAMAPRFSLLLPTGDYKKGFGRGAIGLQTNIPLSV
ncbi:MAG: transporter, partial [Nitrospirae bacterium]|nr:transporter [Nitrospirota bacterium]